KVSAEETLSNQYLIKVNRICNTVTVYEKNDKGKYNVPVKSMVCSVGLEGMETPLGTYKTKAKYRWRALVGQVYGQYATRIVGGILFHSVPYDKAYNPASLPAEEYNKLGSPASHGCVRLSVADAKWIYDNCKLGMTVIIYDNILSPGPLGKPEAIKIPKTMTWDPTDLGDLNPYTKTNPKLYGVKDKEVEWGEELDLYKGISAKTGTGQDITSSIAVDGVVDTYYAGDYEITYTVMDSIGRKKSKTVTITVKECEDTPALIGVEDLIVAKDTVINRDYLMTGVKAYCLGNKLDKNDIKVSIKKVNETQYLATYYISIGKTSSSTLTANVYVDQEAPVISGLADQILITGEVPTYEDLLSGVEINDNYSMLTKKDIKVTVDGDKENGYTVLYEAEDEVGNHAATEVLYYY
ncbi:MAG: L,D-transpeptidase family protein, partial [Mobilitalea sp.]